MRFWKDSISVQYMYVYINLKAVAEAVSKTCYLGYCCYNVSCPHTRTGVIQESTIIDSPLLSFVSLFSLSYSYNHSTITSDYTCVTVL